MKNVDHNPDDVAYDFYSTSNWNDETMELD
jgi:hypothetical protein